MHSVNRLWWTLGVLFILSFGALLFIGSEIHREAPPMPERVVTNDGQTVFVRDDIERGRQVWQSMGGQQLGSIWGHGSYFAAGAFMLVICVAEAWRRSRGAPAAVPAHEPAVLQASGER